MLSRRCHAAVDALKIGVVEAACHQVVQEARRTESADGLDATRRQDPNRRGRLQGHHDQAFARKAPLGGAQDELDATDAQVRRRTHSNSTVDSRRHSEYALLRRLDRNDIRAEGAKHISEALKTNSTLQTLGCAATHPILCCQ